MIRFLTDEDFNIRIFSGIRTRMPGLDIVRVQDCGLRTFRDPVILEFAAASDRVILSHDISTMEPHAKSRITAGKVMPGVFLIHQFIPIGQAIEEIVTIAECSKEGEWANQILRLPL
jgi:hypothetical protein